MPRLVWDNTGEKKFEGGVDQVVHYPLTTTNVYSPGYAWNGVTSISETPEGGEPESQYADNIKYLTILSAEELNGSIEAYTYPDSWAQCDGNTEVGQGVMIGQQARRTFGLCYRTKIGNDVEGQNFGYKLHLLYGAVASPSERSYETFNESPEAMTMNWDYSTTPVPVTGHAPTALITIDSTKVDAEKLKALEDVLYGTDTTTGGGENLEAAAEGLEGAARLPFPDEVFEIMGITGSNPARFRSRSYSI